MKTRAAINAGAFEADCMPKAAKGYLDRLTSESGPLREFVDTEGNVSVDLMPEVRVQLAAEQRGDEPWQHLP